MVARDDALPVIGEDAGRIALLVDGVVQSVRVESLLAPSGYWWHMLPDRRPRRALLLGLGGGTVAQLLQRRFRGVSIVGVEQDATVLELARSTLLHDVPLDAVLADAHAYIAETDQQYDYICVDLFRGHEIDRRILGRPFLRHIQRALARGGTAAFNLFQDKRTEQAIARIGRVLRVMDQTVVGKNVIIHSRA